MSKFNPADEFNLYSTNIKQANQTNQTDPLVQSSQSKTIMYPQNTQYQAKYMQTSLQRHCAFFDRDCDGIISLSDTFSGLRALGFNPFISFGATIFIHLAMSYQTSPSWIPSPYLPIYLDRINRSQHGSSTKAYDFVGNIVSYPAIQNVFFQFDPKRQGGLNYWQLLWMIWSLRDSFDPFGWALSTFWWTFLYFLAVNDKGILTYEAMMAQYDGSLFYAIENERKRRIKKD